MSRSCHPRFRRHFSRAAMLGKLGRLGRNLRHDCLVLYLLLRNPETPTWIKASIVAVLGYVICPLDAIPDIAPVVGYLDDAAAVTSLLASLSGFVSPEHRRKAKE